MHHYTSFKEDGPTNPNWKITAGGGGAFMHPTHQVPDILHLNEDTYRKNAAFPDAKTSRKIAWQNLKFPFINVRFGVFFGALYLLCFWMAASNSGFFVQQKSFVNQFSEHVFTRAGSILLLHIRLLLANPVLTLLCIFVVWGFYRFADKNRKKNLWEGYSVFAMESCRHWQSCLPFGLLRDCCCIPGRWSWSQFGVLYYPSSWWWLKDGYSAAGCWASIC